MIPKTVSATHARIHFGEIMRHVVEKEEPVFVERSGKPLVVVLSLQDYEKLVGRRRTSEVNLALDSLAGLRLKRSSTIGANTIMDTINELREERHEFNGMP